MADILLDTGPIVALLNAGDRDHSSCSAFFKDFHGRLFTTEAALTEAVYLLGRIHGGPEACLEFFIRGAATVVPQNLESLIRAKELMHRYRNVPMDFADAALVALAEETGIRKIFTLDHRGFTIFRAGGRSFEILPNPADPG